MVAPTEAGPEQAGPEGAFAALALEEDPEEAELAARVAAREAEAVALRAPVAEREAAVAEQEAAVARAQCWMQQCQEALAALVQGLEAAKTEAARKAEELAEAKRQLALHRSLEAAAAAGVAPEEWRDWARGLPDEVLAKVAEKVVAQTEACQKSSLAAKLKRDSLNPAYWTEERIQEHMGKWKRDGNCLFVFAMVCKEWRKAQVKVGSGRLYSRVRYDVLLPGSVAMAKWALAEGCPRENEDGNTNTTMASAAASSGHLELVKWLCGEGGFAMNEGVMAWAAMSGNLELVRWLRGEGCPWDMWTCHGAVDQGHVEVLRWARENGCEWIAETRDQAAAELGYTDEFGVCVPELYGLDHLIE